MKNQILHFTATEAARDFSRLLDRIAAGAEAVIERRGEVVAHITPAASRPRRISECLAIKRSRPSVAPDARFAKDLAKIIRGHPVAEPPAWD